MQEGCSDYALSVAKRYMDYTEHVTLPELHIRCRWCDEECHVEAEADAEVRTEAPVPYDEDNVEADQDPESAEHEKYWQASSTVPHYMNATRNTNKNKALIREFRREYVSRRGSDDFTDEQLRTELTEHFGSTGKALRSLR